MAKPNPLVNFMLRNTFRSSHFRPQLWTVYSYKIYWCSPANVWVWFNFEGPPQ